MYLFDIHLFDLDWAFTDMSGEYLNFGKSSWANYISCHSKCPTTPSPDYTSMPRFAGEWLRPSRTKSWIIKQSSTASAISTVQQRKVSQNPCRSPRCSKFRSSNLLSLSNLVFDQLIQVFIAFPGSPQGVTSRYSWNPQAGSFPASQPSWKWLRWPSRPNPTFRPANGWYHPEMAGSHHMGKPTTKTWTMVKIPMMIPAEWSQR